MCRCFHDVLSVGFGHASAMAAMARLNRIWLCNTISFATKFKLCESLVTPASSTAVKRGLCLLTLCAAFPTWSTKSTTQCKSKINFLMTLQKLPLATVKRRKIGW